jgi:hypothetical protein
MEAACTSETLFDNYFTRQYIPEDKSELHTRHRENLNSYKFNIWWFNAIHRSFIPEASNAFMSFLLYSKQLAYHGCLGYNGTLTIQTHCWARLTQYF